MGRHLRGLGGGGLRYLEHRTGILHVLNIWPFCIFVIGLRKKNIHAQNNMHVQGAGMGDMHAGVHGEWQCWASASAFISHPQFSS